MFKVTEKERLVRQLGDHSHHDSESQSMTTEQIETRLKEFQEHTPLLESMQKELASAQVSDPIPLCWLPSLLNVAVNWTSVSSIYGYGNLDGTTSDDTEVLLFPCQRLTWCPINVAAKFDVTSWCRKARISVVNVSSLLAHLLRINKMPVSHWGKFMSFLISLWWHMWFWCFSQFSKFVFVFSRTPSTPSRTKTASYELRCWGSLVTLAWILTAIAHR